MNGVRFAEGLKVLPVLAPIALTTSEVNCAAVDLNYSHWCTFLVSGGVMTSDSTDTVTITVEAATSETTAATDTAIAFSYRLSAAVNTDTMGAIASATATGYAFTATSDNKTVVVDVDPAVVGAVGADYRFARVVLTPNAEHGGSIISVVALLEPRYPGNSIPSST